MKRTISIAILLTTLFYAQFANAQIKYVLLCAGQSTVISAVNSSSLANPSYSMNPGGITSSQPTFVIAPTVNTDYTVYVTGTDTNSVLVTTSFIYSVTLSGVSFSLTSPQGFTLGCAADTAVQMSVTNVQYFPVYAGPCTYTFIPPGSSFPPANIPYSNVNSIFAGAPGTWSVLARNSFGCTSMDTAQVVLVTQPPAVTFTSAPLSCSVPSAMVVAPVKTGLNYLWSPSGNTVNFEQTFANFSAPTSSVAATLTLQVNDSILGCSQTFYVKVLQNIYPPVAQIAPAQLPQCMSNSVTLINASWSGIPPGVYTATNPVYAEVWKGPAPQTMAIGQGSYVAATSGAYTLEVIDSNNGCRDSATTYIEFGPSASFSHAVTSGVANFNSTSTFVGTNTSYFWDFGDGTFSTAQNPSHTYQNAGSHIVKLKVTNSGSVACADSSIKSVNVTGLTCNANSGFSMVPTATAQVWNAIPDYPWNISAATWDWGDGSSSNTLYTSHQYSAAGMYNICLTVTVSCVASSSTCTSYSVYRSSQQAEIIAVNVISPELATGVAEMASGMEQAIRVYPNPNGGRFYIEALPSGLNVTEIFIRDITGRNVYREVLSETKGPVELQLEPSALSPGVYLVNVTTTDRFTRTVRMVVTR